MKMIVNCSQCGKRYRINQEQIPGKNTVIACPGCGTKIKVGKPDQAHKSAKTGGNDIQTIDLSQIDPSGDMYDYDYSESSDHDVVDLRVLNQYIVYPEPSAREGAAAGDVSPTKKGGARPDQTAKPEILPGAGTYTSAQEIAVACVTKDAIIRITTDGTEPDENSPIYKKPIKIISSTTIKARAFHKKLGASDPAEETYKIVFQVDRPSLSLESGAYSTAQIVTLSCPTPGAKLHFTTDGAEPNQNSLVYATPIGITESVVIKARAFKKGWKPSKITTGEYSITGQVAQPTFWVRPGTYDGPQKVEIFCADPGARIHYAFGSDDPTKASQLYTEPLEISKSTQIRARAFKSGWATSDAAVGEYEITGQVEKPNISPRGGLYIKPQKVVIKCSTPAAEIRYTVDGSSVTPNSTIYTGPLEIGQTMILAARAFKPGWQDSPLASQKYKITGTVADPVFSLRPGSYTATQTVFISCATPESQIYYTLDGSQPDEKSTLYSEPFLIHKNTLVKAGAYRTDWAHSLVVEADYKITGTVMAPVFSIPPGSYYQAQTLALSCPTPEALIYYTLDGTEPTEDSNQYLEPIKLIESATVTVRAFKQGWATSSHLSGFFDITGDLAAPEASLPSGAYTSARDITLSCESPGAEIYYSLDGSEPTRASTLYSGPIHVDHSLTLKAKALKPGWRDSETASMDYEITGTAAAPFFSLKPGSYTTAQTLFISCATSEAQIHYTLSGEDPSKKDKLYKKPINLSDSAVVKARAFRAGWTSSSVVEAAYKITGTVDSPVFSILPGTYPQIQELSIACSSPEALIYYTLDGTEPDREANLYTKPIKLTGRITVTAKAFKPDWLPSNIVSGAYEITGEVAAPVILLKPGSYAEAQPAAIECDTPKADIFYTTDGSEPTNASMPYSRPVTVNRSMILTAKAFKTGWKDSNSVSAAYEITGSAAPPEFSIPPGSYTSRQVLFISCATPNVEIRYTTDGTTPAPDSELFTTPIDIKENVRITARAFRSDWTPSGIVKADYQITGRVASPRFSPPPGMYTSKQSVSLTCSTPGSAIFYTIDRTEPTESSIPYKAPLKLTKSCTFFARAFKSGWVSSEVAAATYDIFRQVQSPILSKEQGAYEGPISVTISSKTNDAKIHYTLDGTEPTESSALYGKPVRLKKSATIAARAFKAEWTPSEINWTVYHITQPRPQAPIPKPAEPDLKPETPAKQKAKAAAKKTKKKPEAAPAPVEKPVVKSLDDTATIQIFDIHILTEPQPKPDPAAKPVKPAEASEKDKVPVVRGPLPEMQYVVDEEWLDDGAEITEEGKFGNWFWVILEGAVDIVHETPQGQAPIIRLGPGSFPGSLASVLYPGLNRTATTMAVGKTCLGIMDIEKIMMRMAYLSEDSRGILKSLVKRIIQVTNLTADLYFKKPYADPDISLAEEPIIKQGRQDCGLHKIVEGQACIFRTTQKGRICMAALGKDDYFGLYPFSEFGCEPYDAAVMATPKLKTAKINQAQIINEFRQLPEVIQSIINNAGQSLFLTMKTALEYLTG